MWKQLKVDVVFFSYSVQVLNSNTDNISVTDNPIKFRFDKKNYCIQKIVCVFFSGVQ